MVQKILLTLEIDDAALDAAQAKADKLIATLKEAEALTHALENAVAIDCADFADRLAAVRALAKEKPPEGGNCEKHSDEWARRVAIVRALAKRHNVSDIVEDAIQQAAHALFKPPD